MSNLTFLRPLTHYLYANGLMIQRAFTVNFIHNKKKSIQSALGLPEKPKRPLNTFLRFFMMARSNISKQMPDAPVTEILKVAAKQWSVLDQKTHDELKLSFLKEQEDYKKSLTRYNESLSEEQKTILYQAERKEKLKKEKRNRRKAYKDLGKPKQPPTSYNLFISKCNHEMPDLKPLKATDRMKILAEKWNNLDQSEKNDYIVKAKAMNEEYQRDLKSWKKKVGIATEF